MTVFGTPKSQSESTLSQRLVESAVGLRFDDLPAAVVDKAKACLFHNSAAAINGMRTTMGQRVRAIAEQEPVRTGARLLGVNTRHSLGTAAFTNSMYMAITNQSDSYRLLTHPGPCVLPAALAVADVNRASGRDLLTAVVAGYEVQSRLACRTLASVHANGFRAAPVFGTLGAAVAAGKLAGLDSESLHHALALAVTVAAGGLEPALAGTAELRFHEPTAARNGVSAAMYAPVMTSSAADCLCGDFGFFNAFVGSADGSLAHSFDGPGGTASFDEMSARFGHEFAMMDVAFKAYPTPGYNNPVVDLAARVRARHQIRHEDIDTVDVELNWLEASYPTPGRPRPALRERRRGTTFAIVAEMFVAGRTPRYTAPGLAPQTADAAIAEFMEKVTVTGSPSRRYFAPRIRVKCRDGTVIDDEFTGSELKVGFDRAVTRMNAVTAGDVVAQRVLDQLASAVAGIEHADDLDPYFAAAVLPGA